MKIIELLDIITNEVAAKKFLYDAGILKAFTNCDKCGSDNIGSISRERYRCYCCKSEWSFRKNSLLYNSNLNYGQFIGVLKLFSLEFTAKEAAYELNINVKSTERIYSSIREILSDGFNLSDEKQDVFFIEFLNGQVNLIFEDTGENCYSFYIIRTRLPGKNTAYRTRIKSRFAFSKQAGEFLSFWRFLRKKLYNYGGTSFKYLTQYLKEIEFRYNSREEDIFNELLCKLNGSNN